MSLQYNLVFKKRRTLAGKLAVTLTVVTVSMVILLILLIMNSIVTQHYSKLINESGKVRGGIQRVIKLSILSSNNPELIAMVDESLEELKKMDAKSALIYNWFDIGIVTQVDERWTIIKELLDDNDKNELLKASEEIWDITNTLVMYVEEKSINTIERIYSLIFMFFIIVVVLGIIQFFTQYVIKDKIEYQAEHDALTGLFNRYYFFREHDRAIETFHIYNKNFALLMLDIDHFKNINDTCGHAAGDKALQFIASTIHDHCRKNDLAVRYGGEEFVLLLQDIDAEDSFHLAERIRTYIEQNSAQAVIPMTVSIGLSSYKKDYTGPIHLGNADKAMYYAKQTGRNRTVDFDSIKITSGQ